MAGRNFTIWKFRSMDFASEEGFATDDGAMKLWNDAIAVFNWEVNGVAG